MQLVHGTAHNKKPRQPHTALTLAVPVLLLVQAALCNLHKTLLLPLLLPLVSVLVLVAMSWASMQLESSSLPRPPRPPYLGLGPLSCGDNQLGALCHILPDEQAFVDCTNIEVQVRFRSPAVLQTTTRACSNIAHAHTHYACVPCINTMHGTHAVSTWHALMLTHLDVLFSLQQVEVVEGTDGTAAVVVTTHKAVQIQ